jgi:hypothetical protein
VTSSITGVSNAIQVNPGPVTKFNVGGPANLTAGAASGYLVSAEDQFNNVVPTYTGTVHLTSTDPQATLQGDYTFVAGDMGSHNLAVTFRTLGTQTLTATDTANNTIRGTSGPINVAPARFSVSAPSSATAGTPFSVTVTVLDGSGNTATNYTGTIHFTTSDGQGVVPGNYTFTTGTGDNGVHTFTNLFTLKTAGTQTVTATDTVTATSTGVSGPINVSPAAATQLVITQQPSPTATAGVAFATQPVVKEEDQFGNVVASDSTHKVTATSTGTAALQGTTTLTLSSGVATFSGLSYNKAETIQIKFTTDAGSFSATSSNIVVSAATASQLVITQQPSPTATAGVAFATQPVVKEEDQFGNVVTSDSTHKVTATSTGTAALQGTTTLTLSSGVATFSGLSYNKAETIQIKFTTDANSSTATSNNIVVSPAAASQLVITQQPSPTATAGVAFATQPVVKEEDAFGNVITSDSAHKVTAASTGTAALQGTTAVTLSSGVATFSGLSYNKAETIQLKFTTDAGSFTATSSSVVVSPAAATQLVITQQPSSTATAGVAFATQPVVQEQDQFGNVVASDSTHTVTAASTGTAALQGTTAVTLANGVATFSGLSYNKAETIQIKFTTNAGSFSATSNNIVVSPAAATHFGVNAPTSINVGLAFSFTVTALDPFNNTATGYTGTVHFTSSDGQAGLPGNSPLGNGTGSFSATLNTPGQQTLTATDTANSSLSGTSGTINVAAAAIHFSVSAPPVATAGSSFNFIVTARDPNNNIVTGYSGTVHFTSTDGQAGLPADMTLTGGTGTFPATLKTAGNQTITGTDTANGQFKGTSNTIAVSAAAASHFGVSGPTADVAGTAATYTVTALDPYGNTDTSYAGTVTLSATDPAASLPAPFTLTSGAGQEAVTFRTAGTWSLTATGPNAHGAPISGTLSGISVSLQFDTNGYQIDDGTGQRSMVRSFTLFFQGNVNPTDGLLGIRQLGSGTPFGAHLVAGSVHYDAAKNVTSAKFTFSGPLDLAGSLPDGRYLAVFQGRTLANFHRLFGDANGDGRVDDRDQALFLKAYRSRVGMSNYVSYFDYNGDASVDSIDYFQFLRRKGYQVNADGFITPF